MHNEALHGSAASDAVVAVWFDDTSNDDGDSMSVWPAT
jgi:hypothetical protein